MKYRGIIFDLDGVIISTDELHYTAWKSLADRLGLPFDRQVNHRLRGVSRMESLDIILCNAGAEDRFSDAEKIQLATEKNDIYRKSLETLTPDSVAPDVLNALHTLKREGFQLAIGSSSKNAKRILERTGLTELFDAVSDGENITKSKPDPEVFLKAAEFILLSPVDCVVVEDAKAGIDAAVAGGFACFGMGDACFYEKATWRIERLEEIVAILQKENAQ